VTASLELPNRSISLLTAISEILEVTYKKGRTGNFLKSKNVFAEQQFA